MNAFCKAGEAASRLMSIGCAVLAIVLVFSAGPNQQAGLFGFIVLLAIGSSTLWATADWIAHIGQPARRRTPPEYQDPSRL